MADKIEELIELCKRANMDVNVTAEGDIIVLDGTTERQTTVSSIQELIEVADALTENRHKLQNWDWV